MDQLTLPKILTDILNYKHYVGAALTEYTGLSTDTESYSSTIFVDFNKRVSKKIWNYLKIDDEIITYTGIGTTSFTGCVRGFSGVRCDGSTYKTCIFCHLIQL